MADKLGFIFDLDGTLINSTEVGKVIEEEVYKRFEIEIDEKIEAEVEDLIYGILHGENRKNLGTKLMWAIFKKIGLSFFQRIKALILAGKIYKREIKKVVLYEGVEELIEYLDNNSYSYAIATTSSAKEVDDRLIRFPKFYRKFEGRIISRSSVKNMKPDPESFKMASEIMDVPPNRCVMVGDMHTDIKMGKNINAVTIAVLTGIFSKEKFLPHEPDFIFDSVADIPKNIEKIKKMVENN